MPIFTENPPLSLYIHIPWCVKKCPYCDFNSHEAKAALPEELYVLALLQELKLNKPLIQDRPILSIFFGGGTPSLFSAESIGKILEGVAKEVSLTKTVEITMEANPGTIEHSRFADFRRAGVNRLSLGIQSLQDDKLKTLGRIHDSAQALRAIEIAKQSGFDNFNLDIMYGLPRQSVEEALQDVTRALSFSPTHFSWYQLTIEPNTLFYHQRPTLPPDDLIWEMQLAGQEKLRASGFHQYEISAYATPHKQCAHNRNYWEFGDYLGLGAGAHSKLTLLETNEALRFAQVKNPRDYLDATKRASPSKKILSEKDLIFEFMLNGLRLTEGIPVDYFIKRTGLSFADIAGKVKLAVQKELLIDNQHQLIPTTRGKHFLNDLIELFLD